MSPIEHAHFEPDHEHPHDHKQSHWHHDVHLQNMHESSLKSITLAFALNLSFTLIEIFGSYWSGSYAVLADAVHDCGDTISLGLAFYLHKIANRGRNDRYSYGYRRFTLLAAVIAGVFIMSGSFFVLVQSLGRFHQTQPPRAGAMLVLAILGIAVNGFAALKLARGHSHSEGMLKWHLIEDAMGWVIVLIGSLFIYWKGWVWVDPLLALLLSVFIIFNVAKNLKRTVELFLQRKPEHIDLQQVTESIKSVEGVVDLHDLHIWSLDGEQNVMSLHIVLRDAAVKASDVKENIQKIMAAFGPFHTTIETEVVGDPCHDSCS